MIPLSIKRITFISIIASTFIIGIILDYGTVNSISEWNTFYRIVLVLLIAIIGSVFPVLIANSIGKSFYNKQAKMFEQQIEVQARHYEELAASNFELRRFKHDYKNMLIGIERLITDGDTDEAIRLLKKESEIISSQSSNGTFDTGNSIVDAILTEKQQKAKSINSNISFEGAIPNAKIAPTDLCVIFGNTLDNAIEACEKLQGEDENTISVVCKSANSFVFVNITNPVNSDTKLDYKNMATTKTDKANHGFGIYSLKKSLKKYNGSVNFGCENNMFSIDLELNISA